MPDPDRAIASWVRLLAPGGILVLVEGHWATGAGLTAAECTRIVRTARAEVEVRPLSDPILWGKPISDERYLLVSRA
jgi:SAM-dependent methyltransferase